MKIEETLLNEYKANLTKFVKPYQIPRSERMRQLAAELEQVASGKLTREDLSFRQELLPDASQGEWLCSFYMHGLAYLVLKSPTNGTVVWFFSERPVEDLLICDVRASFYAEKCAGLKLGVPREAN